MEESNLDDFFAKKDKSKKKGKPGKTSGDILTEKADKPKKSKKKKEKDQPGPTSSVSEQEQKKHDLDRKEEDAEWQDYQEEEEKDLTGLKIQNLQMGKEEEDNVEKEGEASGSENEEGERREGKEGASGVWNKMGQTATPQVATPVVEKQPEPVEVKPDAPTDEAEKQPSKYIPPGMRRAMESGGMSSSSTSSSKYSRRKNKQAPNVMSELDFPTLGGATGPFQNSGDAEPGRFEQVRSGGRQTDDHRMQSSKLEIGNKFDALAGAEG